MIKDDHIEKLEELLDVVSKKGVIEFEASFDGCSFKVKFCEKPEKHELVEDRYKATDEDILHNPYIGI